VSGETPTERRPWRLVNLPKIVDARGNLTPVEAQRNVPFPIKRVYWIYGVPGGETRGGHAYRELEELIVALSGSFDVVLDDGRREERFMLNRGYMALYVPRLVWRQLENFSTNGVCLVLASRPYEERDYVRSRAEFRDLT
jgi:dTDP-4-dehydrorhamnose 3,5-epimerase-like enzyme